MKEATNHRPDAQFDEGLPVDLAGYVARHPYGTVAAALGIGYALGGGIFTPLTSRLLRLGLRIGVRTALLPILKAELSELAQSFASGNDSQES
jgi:hypothetical protein